MLTRGGLAHQYAQGGYYPEPYHVVFLADAYPVAGRPEVARVAPAALNPAVTAAGGAGFRPYVGMDPADPGTWPRPYNPQEGMFARLHQEQEQAARKSHSGKGRASK
jgi:hypothetical protein